MAKQYLKIYVSVNSDFDKMGNLYPRKIRMSDGRSYEIDSVNHIRHIQSPNRYEWDCYNVLINGQPVHLFFEKMTALPADRLGRWFVCLKQPVFLSKEEGRALNVYSFPEGKNGPTTEGWLPSAKTV